MLLTFLNPLDRYDTDFLVHTLKELYLPRLEKGFSSKAVLDILAKYRQLRVFEFGGDILKVTEVLDQWSEYASHVTHLIVRGGRMYLCIAILILLSSLIQYLFFSSMKALIRFLFLDIFLKSSIYIDHRFTSNPAGNLNNFSVY